MIKITMKGFTSISAGLFILLIVGCQSGISFPFSEGNAPPSTSMDSHEASPSPPLSNPRDLQDAESASNENLGPIAESATVIVPFEEFDFGGYVILVREAVGELYRDEWGESPDDYADYPVRHKYAIIGQRIGNYDEGREYYELLNNRFYAVYEPEDISILDRDDAQECIRAYFSRNIEFIAATQNRVLCSSPGIIPNDIRYSPYSPKLYEIFEDGEIMHSLFSEEHYFQTSRFQPFYELSSYVLEHVDTPTFSGNHYFSLETGTIAPLPLQWRSSSLGMYSESPDGTMFAILEIEGRRNILPYTQRLNIYSVPGFQLLKSIPLREIQTRDDPEVSNIQFLKDGRIAYDEYSFRQGIRLTYYRF